MYGNRAKIKLAHLTIQRHCQTAEEQQALKTLSAITSCCWNEFDLSQMNTCIGIKGERKQRRRGRQRKRPLKSNRFRLTKQQLCTCITLFCTFVYFFAATARFVWDVDTRRISFFFSWTSTNSFRIQLQKKLPKLDELDEMELAR